MSTALLEPPQELHSGEGRRILLVAYCFPPVGGAGVQRPVKWVKYLQRAGWQVTVLTPTNPSVPVIDESLLAEIPEDTQFLRAPTLEPGYAVKKGLASPSGHLGWMASLKRWAGTAARHLAKLALQPDPQILWYLQALSAATNAWRRQPFDAIICTAPPYTSFLIGRALKRRFGAPLILDYRDEWDVSSQYLEHAQRDRWSAFIQERMQNSVLRSADAVIATTESSTRRLAEKLSALGTSARTLCIYNGYDVEDFEHEPTGDPVPTTSRFRLVYTGTLWNLTTIEPLVRAIQQVQSRRPDLAATLELVCVGRKTAEQQQILSQLTSTSVTLINRDYCDHSQVLKWLASSDALCLLLSDVPAAERVVPAKLFEYLAARKDLLAIVPDGEAAEIVERFHPASRHAPRSVDNIADWLVGRLEAHACGESPAGTAIDYGGEDIAEFSRGQQTAKLMTLLNELLTPRGHR